MESPPVLSYPDKGSQAVAPDAPSPLRRLASVACKLIALYVASQVVQQAIGLAGLWVVAIGNAAGSRVAWGPQFATPLISLVLVAGPVAAAVFLWVRADWLAGRMVRDDGPALPAGPGYDGLLSIGLAVTGAAVLVPAVRDLVGVLAVAAQSQGRVYDGYLAHSLWSAVAGVALSAWLMFGSGGLVRLIGWARTAGRPATPADQPAE